ncbi:uncharacterized protein CCOS01_13563 [Colletotrichum costaricense]|uniref:Uncharacterized protein n=1 Tax=Colletotrichum costaricense TaxID=1209916 RepID=A0AAI9YKK1_9PEZI|nr:uncharacterized protein CCOS01_13563 [Colletotrichum costaricense]KAK1514283.1 hypothetical protein CCOS01_13563 [Colletotrichum costaricense]
MMMGKAVLESPSRRCLTLLQLLCVLRRLQRDRHSPIRTGIRNPHFFAVRCLGRPGQSWERQTCSASGRAANAASEGQQVSGDWKGPHLTGNSKGAAASGTTCLQQHTSRYSLEP